MWFSRMRLRAARAAAFSLSSCRVKSLSYRSKRIEFFTQGTVGHRGGLRL
jgi:hypothetical protein